MKMYVIKYLVFIMVFSSCATANKSFDRKQYRHSKPLTTYKGMTNEFHDGYLVLRENGYFDFYEKFWVIVTIKQGSYVGRYSKSNDTLYLNWLNNDPKQIKYYLSKKCVIGSGAQSLWFVDELSDEKLWGMHVAHK